MGRRSGEMKPRRRNRRGQAMLEYSVVTWLLVVALLLGATVRIFPGPRQNRNIIELFWDAFRTHYDSFYFMLNLPFP